MLEKEAVWFSKEIAKLPAGGLFPMLNIGSQNELVRKEEQPWIDEYLFAPMREKKQKVLHLDIQAAAGVDIVGDLTETSCLTNLSNLGIRSAFCANLLEHVTNPKEICEAMCSIIPPGGYFLISAPYKFPYHPDPIDTMFRPDVEELVGLFPGTSTEAAVILDVGTYGEYLLGSLFRDPAGMLTKLRGRTRGRLDSEGAPAQNSEAVWEVARRLGPWMFRKFKITCVILKKK